MHYGLICFGIIVLVVCSGCTGQAAPALPANPAAVTSPPEASPPAPAGTPSSNLSQATRVEVTTIMSGWTNGPVKDGITVHPALIDASGRKIVWSGTTLPVEIEIYSIQLDTRAKPEKGQKIYGGQGTISNWTDGDAFRGGGIRVPFNQMEVPSGERFGWTYATVTLPDGRTLTGQFNATSLRAPVPSY